MTSFKKELLLNILVGVILAIIFAVSLFYFSQDIIYYSNQVREVRKALLQRAVDLSSLAFIKNQYDQKGKFYLTILKNLIPSRDQLLLDLSKEIQAIASGAESFGVSFLEEKPAENNRLGVVVLGINLKMNLEDFKKFLENVGKFRYILVIDNFSLNKEAEDRYQISMRARTFFR